MAQLIEFAGNHLMLVTAFVVVSLLLLQNLAADAGGKGSVDPQQATNLINRQDAVVVDVRPMADFASGHIINAINIPINSLDKQMGQLEKHKARPIIVNCRSGATSQMACRQLRKSGFEQVYNLRGGILAWQSANLPIRRK